MEQLSDLRERSRLGELVGALAGALLVWLLALLPVAAAAQSAPVPAPSPATAASAPRRGADNAQQLPQVQIQSRRPNEVEERRTSTAAKIVIGRDEIEQFGDASLGDVLRRLPGVTLGGRPGRGGEVRMRGMGSGYTQILIDGQRAPPGFSFEQLSPDMVERIEILRAPTAETGARAIAGTINIVLREPMRRLSDDLRLGASSERGRLSPNVGWTRNDGFGDNGSYNLTLSGNRTNQRTDTLTHSVYLDDGATVPSTDRRRTDVNLFMRETVSLSGRVQWRLGAGEHFTLQPFFVRSRADSGGYGTLQDVDPTPAPYATRDYHTDSDYGITRLGAQLVRRLNADTRFELGGYASRFDANSLGAQEQFLTDGTSRLTQTSDTVTHDRSVALNGKLMREWGEGHSLVAGAEFEHVQREQDALTRVVPGAGSGLLPRDVAENLRAGTRRIAAYLQDEWEPAKNWSANLGVRAEQIVSEVDDPDAPVRNTTSVISPLAHLVWRFNAPARDQLRLSLTHSYRPPTLQSLTTVPSLNTEDPVPGPNNAATADRIGNPNLKPEVAHGIDLAFEHYLEAGGIVSVNLFHRRIRDVIRNDVALEDVDYADVPRWVSRPQNLGNATTTGIEFDAKGRLSEFVEGWPAIQVHANLGLFRSHVKSVPGPDNRIDQQPSATANVGFDTRLPGTPLTVGATLGITPAYRTQLTELQAQELGLKRIVDAYALWQIDPSARLRLSLSNLRPIDSLSLSTVRQGSQLQSVETVGRSDLSIGLRLEMKL